MANKLEKTIPYTRRHNAMDINRDLLEEMLAVEQVMRLEGFRVFYYLPIVNTAAAKDKRAAAICNHIMRLKSEKQPEYIKFVHPPIEETNWIGAANELWEQFHHRRETKWAKAVVAVLRAHVRLALLQDVLDRVHMCFHMTTAHVNCDCTHAADAAFIDRVVADTRTCLACDGAICIFHGNIIDNNAEVRFKKLHFEKASDLVFRLFNYYLAVTNY